MKISRQIGGEIVIASGVKGGDQVITEIPQALRPGATVRIADPSAEGARKGEGKKGKGGKKGEGKGSESPKEAPKQ